MVTAMNASSTQAEARKEESVSKLNVLQDAYVKELLARLMYLQWCRHKAFDPRPFPYSDAGSKDYASVAVDVLGYDAEAVSDLEDILERWSEEHE
jgi:hypothetical protein